MRAPIGKINKSWRARPVSLASLVKDTFQGSTMIAPLLLSVSLFSGQASSSVDLSQIDRSIGKEPVYATKTPKYCLFVFGPGGGTRVWVVLDGDTLYVDRNGNGDLTEPGEKVGRSGGFALGNITEQDGKT